MADNTKIHDFKELLDAIDTPGGHIFACICLGVPGVLLGIFVTWLFWDNKELAVMAAGFAGGMSGFLQVAAYAMRGTDKANGKQTTVTKTIEETKKTETPSPTEPTPTEPKVG